MTALLTAGERRTRIGLVLILSAICVAVLCWLHPIAIGATYHIFADKRTLAGIPNCLDVLSNLPFIIVGAGSLWWLAQKQSHRAFLLPQERWPYWVFFIGVTVAGFGSLWYHVMPDDARLPFDLGPMTLSFMSMLAAVIMERVSVKAGLALLAPLLIFGVGSVVWWCVTGDYRFYLFVQFCPPLLIATIIGLFPARYTGNLYLVIAFLFFVLAKLFEMFDWQIYSSTGFVSGHSLKHATAGVACYWVVLMLAKRRPLASHHSDSAEFERREEFA